MVKVKKIESLVVHVIINPWQHAQMRREKLGRTREEEDKEESQSCLPPVSSSCEHFVESKEDTAIS
jgi:hypothetical protein